MKLTKKDLLENPKDLKIAIHCDTKEKAQRLMTWYDSKGYKWAQGVYSIFDSPLHEFDNGIGSWGLWEDRTAYDHGNWLASNGKYTDVDLYKVESYTIITCDEFFEIIEGKDEIDISNSVKNDKYIETNAVFNRCLFSEPEPDNHIRITDNETMIYGDPEFVSKVYNLIKQHDTTKY